MGNCFTNEDDRLKQKPQNITSEEVISKINKMREYWKIRADKKSQNLSLMLKKDMFNSEINFDENNISKDHSKYSFSSNL
jgi:hypothetical protein